MQAAEVCVRVHALADVIRALIDSRMCSSAFSTFATDAPVVLALARLIWSWVMAARHIGAMRRNQFVV